MLVPIYSSGIVPWPPPSTGPAITAGATKGSNVITVSDTSDFAPDMLFKISPRNTDMGAQFRRVSGHDQEHGRCVQGAQQDRYNDYL